MKWKIWYSDGTTYTDQDGLPYDAPKTGAVIIVQEEGRTGWRKLFLQDYFVWSPSLQIWMMQNDAAGVIMRAVQEPFVVVVSGTYMRELDFQEILIEADNDEYIRPKKSEPPHLAWSNISGR